MEFIGAAVLCTVAPPVVHQTGLPQLRPQAAAAAAAVIGYDIIVYGSQCKLRRENDIMLDSEDMMNHIKMFSDDCSSSLSSL